MANSEYHFEGQKKNLKYIFERIKYEKKDTIYIRPTIVAEEFQAILAEYLYYTGNFVVPQSTFTASFKDVQQQIGVSVFLNAVCQEHGLKLVDISTMSDNFIKSASISRDILPQRIEAQLSNLEKRGQKIVLIRTNNKLKVTIREKGVVLVNFDHPGFQALIAAERSISDGEIDIYLSGLFGTVPGKWVQE